MASSSFAERLWSGAIADGTGCWVWQRSGANGYGQLNYEGKHRYAHRAAYELVKGPIPDGFQIDHLCRTPACINPDHLEAVTQRENLIRGDTIPAANAQATHCPQGHRYAGANLIIDGHSRRCRTCKNERRRVPRNSN